MNSILKRFERKTNGKNFVPQIDGLRFFAILTVFIFHLNTSYSRALGGDIFSFIQTHNPLDLGWWIIRMDIGVKFFFAISGFILSLSFIKARERGTKVSLKSYFLRRLSRLEPPYLIVLLGFAVAHTFLDLTEGINLVERFFVGIFYGHGFIYGQSNPINPVSWSLETEAQFYLLLPLFFWVFFKLPSKLKWVYLLIVVMGGLYLKSWIAVEKISFLSGSILNYSVNFITGIVFALTYTSSFWKKLKNSYWFDLLGLVSIFAAFYFYKPQVGFPNMVILNLAIYLHFIAAFKGNLLSRFYSIPFVYVVGGMCYTIYLLHYGILIVLMKFLSSLSFDGSYALNLLLMFALAFPIIMAISGVFYKLIEQPCMDKEWPKKLIAKFKRSS